MKYEVTSVELLQLKSQDFDNDDTDRCGETMTDMTRKMSTLSVPSPPNLPFVATSPRPSLADLIPLGPVDSHRNVPDITFRPSTSEGEKEHIRMRGPSAMSRSSMWGGSVISLDRFSNFEMDDIANLSMDDNRWTLNREKLGLARKTKNKEEHLTREKQTREMNLHFILNNFTRKECLRYVKSDNSKRGRCHCGLTIDQHLPLGDLIPRHPLRPKSSQIPPGFETVIEDPEGEAIESNSTALEVIKSDNNTKNLESGLTLSRRSRVYPINAPSLSKSWPLQDVPPADTKWDPNTHLRELPTNAYGRIIFTNESSGKCLVVSGIMIALQMALWWLMGLVAVFWVVVDTKIVAPITHSGQSSAEHLGHVTFNNKCNGGNGGVQ
ncbi:uncharacterized protein LOC122258395 [Penaeus japonicus]|uniref:uncharacterized protein LOC122258395 n=1 Tax=Penaeus japonicus TaxID=27405 RepID=UPI001C712FB0|nr:uncharacterized protein LOC122258395 [Penaeus japonicus]